MIRPWKAGARAAPPPPQFKPRGGLAVRAKDWESVRVCSACSVDSLLVVTSYRGVAEDRQSCVVIGVKYLIVSCESAVRVFF